MNHILTECYNCTGVNTQYNQGRPKYGCNLCIKFGKGKGKLYKEFRFKQLEIKTPLGEKEELVEIFMPPNFNCVFCQDKLKAKYKIWVFALEDAHFSDNGFHKMPWAELPCHKCKPKEFDFRKRNKEIELNSQTL